MSSDEDRAAQLALALDLASLVADVRAERVETLPEDSRFALALVLLSRFDEGELAELLAVPEEIAEGAGRHLSAEAQRELTLCFLKDLGKRKGNP